MRFRAAEGFGNDDCAAAHAGNETQRNLARRAHAADDVVALQELPVIGTGELHAPIRGQDPLHGLGRRERAIITASGTR
jgi:hypothetical protein